MPKKEYEWEDDSLPTIYDHSLAKHNALKNYLIRFVKALSPQPMQTQLRLDIIEGFSGGGLYKTQKGEPHLGSPLLILNALEEARVMCELARKDIKKIDRFEILGDRIFVDTSLPAINNLRKLLKQHGYGQEIEKSIFLINDSFESQLPKILNRLKDRKNKAIFILDQYGYKDATIEHIKHIFEHCGNKAEVILTLATDSIISYMSKQPQFKAAIQRAKLEHVITDQVIERFCDAPTGIQKLERVAIQYIIAQSYHKLSGARWGNSLFIRSRTSNRAYLYLHLSNNFRAREEMNQVFWEESNSFVQDAGKGINMFEYDPDDDIQQGFEFLFDDNSGSITIDELEKNLLSTLRQLKNEISFSQLLETSIESVTPAGQEHFQKAIFRLQEQKEICVINESGGTRQKSNTINLKDRIKLPPQQTIIF